MTFELRNGVPDAAEELVSDRGPDQEVEMPAKGDPSQEPGTKKPDDTPTDPFEGFGSFTA